MLYRGELESRHQRAVYGIAWTSKLRKADWFARIRVPAEDPGVILAIDAPRDAIIAGPHADSNRLGEFEYIVYPGLMGPVLVKARYDVLNYETLKGG